jgi:hypothetical protein
MPLVEGTLLSGTPPGPDVGWFTPPGPFLLYRDGGAGTLALNVRPRGATGVGVPTGDTLSQPGVQIAPIEAAGFEYRLTLSSGAGPVAWKAMWS